MTDVDVDLFGGPGGWDVALAALGHRAIGIEWDAAACATRSAAGHLTIRADVAAYPTPNSARTRVKGLIGSPPCPSFSAAGKGSGRDQMAQLLQVAHDAGRRGWTDPGSDWDDPRTPLVLEPLRWILATRPEWVALEQVPSVWPLWEAYAQILAGLGYSTWTGKLNAADYGVPQTRERAILMASATRPVSRPQATHDRDPQPTLFGPEMARWVSMAEAIGWPPEWMVETGAGTAPTGYPEERAPYERPASEPAPTLVTSAGRSIQGHPARTVCGNRNPRWVYDAIKMPGGEKGTVRSVDEPAPTMAFGHDSASAEWVLNTGRDWKPGGDRSDAQEIQSTLPAPAVTAKAGGQWQMRPATTIQGDPRLWPPGHKINQADIDRLGPEEAAARYGDRAGTDALRLTIQDALILQSFDPSYPIAGNKTKAFEQVGNAIPPLLAWHVLRALIGDQ